MCRTMLILIAAGALFAGLAVGQQDPELSQLPDVPAVPAVPAPPPRPPRPPADDQVPQPRERRPGEGQQPGRFGESPHGSDKLAANDRWVFVLRGDVLFQFDARSLEFMNKTKLPEMEPQRPRPGPAGDRPPPVPPERPE